MFQMTMSRGQMVVVAIILAALGAAVANVFWKHPAPLQQHSQWITIQVPDAGPDPVAVSFMAGPTLVGVLRESGQCAIVRAGAQEPHTAQDPECGLMRTALDMVKFNADRYENARLDYEGLQAQCKWALDGCIWKRGPGKDTRVFPGGAP